MREEETIRSDTTEISLGNSDVAASMTRAGQADSTEIFFIPDTALEGIGGRIALEIRGKYRNNTGATRTLSVGVTIGDQLILALTNSAQGITSGGAWRAWYLDVRITRTSDTTLAADIEQVFSNTAATGAAVGDPYGSLGASSAARLANHAFAISGGWPLAVKVDVQHPIASVDLAVFAVRRILRSI